MKKSGIYNSQIARVVADMGHMDWISIGDAGMPVPTETPKIDLAIDRGLPGFISVLENVLTELAVQKIYLAEEIKTQNPSMLEQIQKIFDGTVEIEYIPHTEMKENLQKNKAFIRTGEMTPYANIILESGVVF
ncbi:MAG: D-ribose pyranase [Lactobacillaceae bacterium]|jgi:D-ribose pyranase|nr:D-ribose pyranase [Lactobacillaceae bacterium]